MQSFTAKNAKNAKRTIIFKNPPNLRMNGWYLLPSGFDNDFFACFAFFAVMLCPLGVLRVLRGEAFPLIPRGQPLGDRPLRIGSSSGSLGVCPLSSPALFIEARN
jgi:hypothetical protein